MSVPANHCQILGINIQADDAAIKKAYKKIALANHPDKTLYLSTKLVERRTKVFKLAATAYEILLDPVERADYDEKLAQTARPSYTSTAQPSQPSKSHPFEAPPPGTSAPQTPKKTTPFTTGTPLGPIGTTSSPWFYAPVSEHSTRTTLTFSNHDGWSFSISVSKKYKWILGPILPLPSTDTKAAIIIKICMQRNAYSRTVSAMKDVVINVTTTPGDKATAFSSIFGEHRQGVELCVVIGTLPYTPTDALAPTLAWTWSFDVDLGFLIPFYKELRATHLMFYPHYPSHAVGKDGAVPAREPFPLGSPQAGLVSLFEGMQFVAMTKKFYCEEVEKAGRKLWRLAAVGSI